MVEDSNMELKDEIALMANASGACAEGLQELAATVSREDMIKCFFENIKFCLAKHIPSSSFIASHARDIMHEQGLYVDDDVIVYNRKEIAFLGRCKAEVEVDRRMMCRIWAADNSEINVKAYNGARFVVDALDNAKINVIECDNAHITVYQYGNSKCSGADLIVRKGETYEL